VLVGFGAGSGSTTVDLRVVDAATGETKLAIHHRAVSGTTWSTTDSKFVKWAEELAEEGAKKGFEKLYAKGDRVRD
jgi:curli biogenesis system outer membrane secretion channel CsgG